MECPTGVQMHPYDYALFVAFITGDYDRALDVLQKFIHEAIDRKFKAEDKVKEMLEMYRKTGSLLYDYPQMDNKIHNRVDIRNEFINLPPWA